MTFVTQFILTPSPHALNLSDGFTYGLQLMDMAIELGADTPKKPPRPEHNCNLPVAAATERQGNNDSEKPAGAIAEDHFPFNCGGLCSDA